MIRDARGLTQQDLADLAGTTNQQIGHLEKGKRKLTVDWMNRLAPHLGVPPSALMFDHADVGGTRDATLLLPPIQANSSKVFDTLRRSIQAALVLHDMPDDDAAKVARKAAQIFSDEMKDVDT